MGPDQGRGMRETAPRSAFVPSVRPSWASSPAACTAVPTSSRPSGGCAGRLPGVEEARDVAAEGRPPAGLRAAGLRRLAAGLGLAAAGLALAAAGLRAAA